MNKIKWIALLPVLLLWGCNSQLTLENYNKISVGMSFDEVTKLIGKPEKCDDLMGIRTCHWGDDKGGINVNFAGDKAMIFSAENLH
ncbi:hypothetical protein [Sulfuriferula nivalis]|uniref:Lipoprotein n=1 Tax=Sulfuriferula nivalis TaxID=2675298 RepID=A0A809RKS3_9PROT|nr:hypothetical protein [Sulfuriferula nivalis]BBP01404.1 hypothetical protein SFSGTM_21120 [Sulfuriferula nivalis]